MIISLALGNSTFYIHPEYLAPPSQYVKQRNMEFNVVNPNYSGRKYQFTYGVGMPESYLAGSILKMDVIKKEFVKIWEDTDCMATEPQFVPRSKTCAFLQLLHSQIVTPESS